MLPHKLFDAHICQGFETERAKFIASISYTEAERKHITDITVGQRQNCEWFRQHMGSVTASKFGSVLRFMQTDKGKVERLIKSIQNYEQRNPVRVPQTHVPSLKWGCKCEALALNIYKWIMRSKHQNLVLHTTGLHVDGHSQFLRASPDGIVSCSCHSDKRLIEIKCPWTARNVDPVDAVATGVIKYIRETNGSYSLVPGDSFGYYEQVQGTMAITETKTCDFIVWTLSGVLVFPVDFDANFWENGAKPMLTMFFCDYVVAEILTERVWRALPLFVDSCVQKCTESGGYEDDDIEPENATDEMLTIDELVANELASDDHDISLDDTAFDADFFDVEDFAEEVIVE